jgi:sigma-B regulation protein RsbU (phosphoserine phosphatase)
MASAAALTADLKYRLLLEISQKISGTFDLQTVLTHLLDSIRSVIDYDAAGIFVVSRSVPLARDAGPFRIVGMVQVGFEKPRSDDPMLRFGKGIIGHVVHTGETVIAPDVRVDPYYVEGRSATLSEIAVPVVSNGQVIGALNLESDCLDAFSATDVELLEFFASAAAISIDKAILHRQVLEKQRMEAQLRVARDVQASLLPARPPALAGYDIAGTNLPTWEIGGDYYDYIPLSGGRLGFVVADVAGKGIPAALIMASFRATLRATVRKECDICGVVEDLNRFILEFAGISRFVTGVYGVFDPSGGSLHYVNCGHNPPLLLHSGGGRELLERGGPALGIIEDCRFECATVTLDPGDLMAFYTDGVVELSDAEDVEFGVDRLEGVLRDSIRLPAAEMIRSVVDATRVFAGRDRYDDDFTLVLIKRESPG